MRLWRRKRKSTFKNGDRVMVTRRGRFWCATGEVIWDESKKDTHYEVKIDSIFISAGLWSTYFFKTDELSLVVTEYG